MFNLEAEIQRWRERLKDCIGLRPDLLDELEEHLREEFQTQVASGADPASAFSLAEQQLGNPALLAAEYAKLVPSPKLPLSRRVASSLCLLAYELRLACRRLLRRRTQNLLLLGTFAISITLACVSWSLFRTTFLSRPEFDPRGRLHVLTYVGDVPNRNLHLTREELSAYQDGADAFDDFAPACLYQSIFVRTPRGAERLFSAFVSSRALSLVGARPLLGRLFSPADDVHDAPLMIILSERMWENSFDRDPNVVGKSLILADGYPGTIVGVMPRSFRFPNDQDFWLSYGSAFDNPSFPIREALVTLRAGIAKEQAERQLATIAQRLGPDSPVRKLRLKPVLVPFHDYYLLPANHVSAAVLFALSLVFVLVSCANAANLMLMDFLGRRPEVAATLALGIPRAASIRAICLHVGLLATGAAAVSLAVLPVAGPLLFERTRMINTPYWLSYQFTASDAAMALVLALVSALVTVVAPIAYLLWADADRIIREHSTSVRSAGRSAWRRSILVGQIALLTILGVSSGVLLHTSYAMGSTHWGYPAERIFMGKISAFGVPTTDENQFQLWGQAERAALREIEARPDTEAAALADESPGYSHKPGCSYALDAAGWSTPGGMGRAFYSAVTENFFAALDVPFVAGQTLPKMAPNEGPLPAVINESLAKRLWPGQDPLHRALYIRTGEKDNDPPLPVTVCGIVRDFQASGPFGLTNDGIFVPYRPKDGMGGSLFVYVRDRAGTPGERSIADAVHRGDSRMALYFPSTVSAQINLTLSSLRTSRDLTTVFLFAAVVLCAVGIYSLTVSQILQSTREFGIRMALGGAPFLLWRKFTRGHLMTVLLGVGLGLFAASQVVRSAKSILYGISPYHVGVLGAVAGGILIVAALACLPSLSRLRRINPADCLRSL